MSDIAKLREEHEELIDIVGRLADVVARPAPSALAALFSLRWELNSTLIAHLKAEDWALYPQLLNATDPEIAALANAFIDEMGGLGAALAAYNHKWPAPAIHADWDGYCRHSSTIIEALTTRIMRENYELYPLLDAVDQAA